MLTTFGMASRWPDFRAHPVLAGRPEGGSSEDEQGCRQQPGLPQPANHAWGTVGNDFNVDQIRGCLQALPCRGRRQAQRMRKATGCNSVRKCPQTHLLVPGFCLHSF